MTDNERRLKRLGDLFKSQYKIYTMEKDDTAIEFSTNGAEYRIYLPVGDINEDGSMDISLKLRHLIDLRSDDEAEIKFLIDENGQYRENSFHVSFDYSDAPQIPDWFIDTSSKVVNIAAVGVGVVAGAGVAAAITAIGTGASGGTATVAAVPVGVALGATAGSAVTAAAIKTIGVGLTGSMSLFNYLSPKVADFSDDGGSLFFTEIISHAINNINTAVLDYNNIAFDKKLKLDKEKFITSIGQKEWDDKDGNAVKYKSEGQVFRTWQQEISINYLNIGMLVSCKIERMRDYRSDDYIILKASYDMYGRISSAQATLSMSREPTVTTGSIMHVNGVLSQVNADDEVVSLESYDDIHDAMFYLLKSGMRSNENYSDYSEERKNIPYVIQANLINMSVSVISEIENPDKNGRSELQAIEI